MGLSLAQMREHIYTFYEIDTDDVPHSLIDRWASEGFKRVSRFRKNWPFYATTATMDTVSGQYVYDDPSDMPRSVENVLVEGYGKLQPRSLSDAIAHYEQSDGTFTSGTPRVYARHADKLYVFPQQDDVYTITFIGYRDPQAFGSTAGSEPDLPDELHEAVLQWIKYRVYLHQDDTELAEIEKYTFDETLTEFTDDLTATDADMPVTLGGSRWDRQKAWGAPVPSSDWD